MCILVDPRVGSRELLSLIRSKGVKAELSKEQMDAGDFAFEGKGPDGTCLVGIERKATRDMLQCIRTGRFAGHQLPLLLQMYKFQYLIVEGIFRPNPNDGILEEPRNGQWHPIVVGTSRFMYQELMGALFTYERMTALKVHYTANMLGTASHVVSLYRWWNGKDWSKHRAHTASHNVGYVEILGQWPFKRRLAKELYKVGAEKSKAVADDFASARDMANANEKRWMKVPGIGKTIAKKIVEEFNENGK